MIVVLAKLTVKEGKKAELFELARPLMAATRQEAGCVSYTLMDDWSDPARCVFVEEWTDKKALQQHTATPHIKEWRQKSRDLLAAPTEIKLYEAEETAL